jgi:hypothetical protein
VSPRWRTLGPGGPQLLDLAGDGQLDLVALSGPMPGFYERTADEDWEPFRPFRQLPNVWPGTTPRTCASSTWTATATPTC